MKLVHYLVVASYENQSSQTCISPNFFFFFHLNFIIIISLCHSNAGSCFIMEKWWYYAIHIWYGNSSFRFFVCHIIYVDCTGLWFLKHYLLTGNLVSLVVIINGFSEFCVSFIATKIAYLKLWIYWSRIYNIVIIHCSEYLCLWESNLGFRILQAWDLIKLADYLTQREDIDPTRIGITGESLGGWLSYIKRWQN